MPSDSHQDQWSSQWHQWHSSNPMMCTRPMPIKSYLGPCGTCHSLRRTCNTNKLHPSLAWLTCNCAIVNDVHDVLVLVLALALALLLCIKCLGAWQQCVHYNKNNNAYNADTTSDAIQASTWWACIQAQAPTKLGFKLLISFLHSFCELAAQCF